MYLKVKVGHRFDENGFYVCCMVWVNGKLINTPGYLKVVKHEYFTLYTNYGWTVCTYEIPIGSTVLFKSTKNSKFEIFEQVKVEADTYINVSGHDSYGWMISIPKEDLSEKV